jgi:hypothetical protein
LIISEKVKRASERQLDFVGDVIDATLESVLSEDVLSHVPVIKCVVAIWRSGAALTDQLLLRKIDKFLRAISDVPAEDHPTMVQRLESTPVTAQSASAVTGAVLDLELGLELFLNFVNSDACTPVTGSKLVLIDYVQLVVEHIGLEFLDHLFIA